MSYRVITKKDLPDFVASLRTEYEVMGPVEKQPGQYSFSPIDDVSQLVLEYPHTILPPKKHFFPQRETLLTFDLNGEPPEIKAVIESRPLALFGVHACDLHGIQRLDMVFKDENPDPNYLEKRQEALLIGIGCTPDEQCFCASMETMKPPAGGFDLFLTDIGDLFAVEIGSDKGNDALRRHARTEEISANHVVRVNQDLEKKKSQQKIGITIEVDHLPLLFEGEYHAQIWEDLGHRCLSCGACNLVCPTCYCFDVQDKVAISDLNRGERLRRWDGCQLEDFALVAGEENFRGERSDRNRHRFYRKFLYPVLRYKKTFCVGCGRCVRSCLVHISVVDTVNHFVEKSLQGGAR